MRSGKWLKKNAPIPLTDKTDKTDETISCVSKVSNVSDTLERISNENEAYSAMKSAIETVSAAYDPRVDGEYAERLKSLDHLVNSIACNVTIEMIEDWTGGCLDIIEEWEYARGGSPLK